MNTVECGERFLGYFKVIGEDCGGSRYFPFARDNEKFFMLRGDRGEDLYILKRKLDEILANPPSQMLLTGNPNIKTPQWVTCTYNDQQRIQIQLVLRYSINRANIRFV